MSFEIGTEDGDARTGVLKTVHGYIDTPCFLPVCTKGVAKAITWERIWEMGFRAVISNALFLSIRPGTEVISSAGGLQEFTGWRGAFFTDSGGFQGINPELVKGFTDDSMVFQSPTDGQRIEVTPEMVIDIQAQLGSDIVLQLDHQSPLDADHEQTLLASERSLEWADRSVACKERLDEQHLFGIVQGGFDASIRRDSARKYSELDLEGYAIGGLSIGEPGDMTVAMAKAVVNELPRQKPRYLMGLGSPSELLRAVQLGVDIFDSAYPTRNARHGSLLTSEGRKNVGRAQFDGDDRPIDKVCQCFTCRNHEMGYINHLYREKELTAYILGTIHNLQFMADMMASARRAIEMGELAGFIEEYGSIRI